MLEVSPEKIRYQPGERVTVLAALVNPTAAAIEGTLLGEEIRAADTRREVFRREVRLAAGEQNRRPSPITLGPEEYGREIRVRLLVGGREVASGRDFFAVSKLPLWVAGRPSGDRSYRAANNGAGSFFVAPASGQESWRGVQYWKRCGGSISSSSPGRRATSPTWRPPTTSSPAARGAFVYRSRQTVIQQNRMLRSVGIWPVSYVNGTCWAESGYKLFQQHPEWFLYDATGDVGTTTWTAASLPPQGRRRLRPQHLPPHLLSGRASTTPCPPCRQYIARQFIDCGKAHGLCRRRLDVRYLEVYPGERGFDGKEIAATYPEADRISAAAVQHVKALVHKELPDFTFGYNYAGPKRSRT